MHWLNPLGWLKKMPSLPPTLTATICGHQTHLKGPVTALGESITTTMPRNEDGSTDYCLDCIGKMAIRCAWCGGTIFIGDPVTLYTPRSAESFRKSDETTFVSAPGVDFQIPNHAVVFNTSPLQLVGCLRMSCAGSGADRAGFWVPRPDNVGGVQRVQTAFEQILANGGNAVIIGDVNDPRQAVALPEGSHGVPISK